MEGGRGTAGSSVGHGKEDPWGGTSRHTDKHGQPCIDILESGTAEGGRGVEGTGVGDEQKDTWGRTSRHTDKHGQPCPYSEITRPK